tara:strand:- start:1603 stop:1818 length:216 start_codon:yes stop_codon:yes gene_type:complete
MWSLRALSLLKTSSGTFVVTGDRWRSFLQADQPKKPNVYMSGSILTVSATVYHFSEKFFRFVFQMDSLCGR